jgi:hypothetical protein
MDSARRKSIVEELAQNFEGEIRNPLKGIPRDELLKNVAVFQRERDLPEDSLVYLRKGALVAQNPGGFEELADLDESDRDALRTEALHRWKHPWPMYFTIVLNSIAAAIQGWDQVSYFLVSYRKTRFLGWTVTYITTDWIKWCQSLVSRGSWYTQLGRVLMRAGCQCGYLCQEPGGYYLPSLPRDLRK